MKCLTNFNISEIPLQDCSTSRHRHVCITPDIYLTFTLWFELKIFFHHILGKHTSSQNLVFEQFGEIQSIRLRYREHIDHAHCVIIAFKDAEVANLLMAKRSWTWNQARRHLQFKHPEVQSPNNFLNAKSLPL